MFICNSSVMRIALYVFLTLHELRPNLCNASRIRNGKAFFSTEILWVCRRYRNGELNQNKIAHMINLSVLCAYCSNARVNWIFLYV